MTSHQIEEMERSLKRRRMENDQESDKSECRLNQEEQCEEEPVRLEAEPTTEEGEEWSTKASSAKLDLQGAKLWCNKLLRSMKEEETACLNDTLIEALAKVVSEKDDNKDLTPLDIYTELIGHVSNRKAEQDAIFAFSKADESRRSH